MSDEERGRLLAYGPVEMQTLTLGVDVGPEADFRHDPLDGYA